MSHFETCLLADVILISAVLAIGLYCVCAALDKIQRTIAALPTAMIEKKDILLPPHVEARQGDVQIHFPRSMTFRED